MVNSVGGINEEASWQALAGLHTLAGREWRRTPTTEELLAEWVRAFRFI
jgi:hypothetical protein